MYQITFFHDTTCRSGLEPSRYRDLMITLRHTTRGRIPVV